jgi:hypothetical protein
MPESNTIATPDFQCRHIFTDGHRCGSRALRKEYFCFYHHGSRRAVGRPGSSLPQLLNADAAFDLPMPEDRAAVQQAIGEVIRRIAHKSIDGRRAGLLLRALQIAAANLPRPEKTAQPAITADKTVDEIVDDPLYGRIAPATEIAPQIGAETPAETVVAEPSHPSTQPQPEPADTIAPPVAVAPYPQYESAKERLLALREARRNAPTQLYEFTLGTIDAVADAPSVPHSSRLQRDEWEFHHPCFEREGLQSLRKRPGINRASAPEGMSKVNGSLIPQPVLPPERMAGGARVFIDSAGFF